MAAPSSISWQDLFDKQKGELDFALRVRVIQKAGEPFLILPSSGKLAARSLSLYPAQTTFARAARMALRIALLSRIPLLLNRAEIRFSASDPFVKFLIAQSGVVEKRMQSLAILAGNPRAEGRRFIVLVFNERGDPVRIIKAGIGEAARRLIERERSFLESASAQISSVPKVCGAFTGGKIDAMAVNYMDGETPGAGDWSQAGKLLSDWVSRATRARAVDVPAWKALASSQGIDAEFRALAAQLEGVEFFPALVHGDFAPWNIKVERGSGTWKAVDWERGELIGFAGWDWFHYVIQTGVLVEKMDAPQLLRKLEALFVDQNFRRYAELAGIARKEKVLAKAYLFYCAKILRQTEGAATIEKLLSTVAEQWA